MNKISKYKVEYGILIPLIIFAIISILTIFSATKVLPTSYNSLPIKQLIWYILGFILAYSIMFIGNESLTKNAKILYIIGIISLIGLFFFGKSINNAKCWYEIKGIGTIQPSEFMKIILIIVLGNMIDNFHNNYNDPTVMEEFKFLFKVFIVVLIPSILTFLQPDTGVVLIYLIITIIMLFVSGIRYRWFVIAFSLLAIIVGIVLAIYFLNSNLFVNIFGTSFFLRVDRLLDWSNGSGYQLEKGLSAIGSANLFGYGFLNTPLYFPEAETDFIFAVYSSNFGFLGSLFLISLITFFDIKLILSASKCDKPIYKYIMAGIIGMLIYQQVQNIGMTFGLLPITGITLPFISYGGSSLLSYMIMMGIVFNISNDSLRYRN